MPDNYRRESSVHMYTSYEEEVMPEVEVLEWHSKARGKYYSVRIDTHIMYMSEAQYKHIRELIQCRPSEIYVD